MVQPYMHMQCNENSAKSAGKAYDKSDALLCSLYTCLYIYSNRNNKMWNWLHTMAIEMMWIFIVFVKAKAITTTRRNLIKRSLKPKFNVTTKLIMSRRATPICSRTFVGILLRVCHKIIILHVCGRGRVCLRSMGAADLCWI